MLPESINIALVALNYSPEATGIGPFAADLAAGLHERGHRVDVTAGYPHYPQWKPLGNFADHDRDSAHRGIDVTRTKHLIPTKPSLVKRSVMEVSFGLRAALAGHDDADLVLCISPPLLATAAILFAERLRRQRRPVVVWVQDLYGLGVAETKGADHVVAKLALAGEARTLRAATGLAVIHDRFRSHLVRDLGVEPGAVEVFRNWSRQEPIALASREEAIAELGWESFADHTIVLHAGNMGAKQGLENVVDAAALADASEHDVLFVLLGDGNQRTRLQERAAGVESIRFIDVLDVELFGYALRAADILLVNQLPGVSDMCVPSKLMTYYLAARPVLAAVADDGITADEVRNAGGGTVVPAGDPARLLDEAARLAADTSAAEAMGAAGRRFVDENFDRDSTIDAISEWLVGLAKVPRSPSGRRR